MQINTRKSVRKQNIIQAVLIVGIIIVLNVLAVFLFQRFDLTKEKRFTISDVSKDLLQNLEEQVVVELYFEENDLPVELLRYYKIVSEFLKNFSSFSNNIILQFKHSYEKDDPEFTNNIYKQLYNKGLNPTYINENDVSKSSEKMIFAGALVKYQEKEYPVNLIKNNITRSTNGFLSETELEKEFIHAIWMLSRKKVQKIAFLEGNGELTEDQTYDIMSSLSSYYQIDRLKMNHQLSALDEYAAVVIAKPSKAYNEYDKFIIDQYLMKGGKLLWLIEWLEISIDSLSYKSSEITTVKSVNIEDQLFNYGVRINPDLIQDLCCLSIPVYVNTIEGKPQFEPKRWYYFPMILPDTISKNSLVKNLEPMRTHFVSSIDTVGENYNVRKTILLTTSQYSKSIMHPVEVTLNILREVPDEKTFSKPNIPIAVLLEGKFISNYRNRLPPELTANKDFKFIEESDSTAKMIVVSDGDFIRNEYKGVGKNLQHYPLGFDKYYDQQYTPGNTQFIINSINYLCADERFISLRMRDIKIRLLNQKEVTKNRLFWTVTNTVVPIVIICLFGITVILVRKIKYKKS